jgi:cytoplasmic tRNA 2-thiolation protein 2
MAELSTLNIAPGSGLDPKASLKAHLAALPTPTAVQRTVATLIRLVLVHTARSLCCSHLLLGTSLTSLSISLIDSIAQGGGFALSQEAYEECRPSSRSSTSTLPVIRIVRPLHDVGMKECGAWTYWHNLEFGGRSLPVSLSSKQTIQDLTKGTFDTDQISISQ